jgi:hypothetical protein
VLSFGRPALKRAFLSPPTREISAGVSKCLVRLVGPLPRRHVNEIKLAWGQLRELGRPAERVRKTPIGGTVRPSAFAVFRLIASSNFVGRNTGSSAGDTPLRTRSIISATRREIRVRVGPYAISAPSAAALFRSDESVISASGHALREGGSF